MPRMAPNGVCIDKALDAGVSDYTYQQGHRVLRVVRKGGKAATFPLNPITSRVPDVARGCALDYPTAQ